MILTKSDMNDCYMWGQCRIREESCKNAGTEKNDHSLVFILIKAVLVYMSVYRRVIWQCQLKKEIYVDTYISGWWAFRKWASTSHRLSQYIWIIKSKIYLGSLNACRRRSCFHGLLPHSSRTAKLLFQANVTGTPGVTATGWYVAHCVPQQWLLSPNSSIIGLIP